MSEDRIYHMLDLKSSNLLVGFKNQIKISTGIAAIGAAARRSATGCILLIITAAASLKGAYKSLATRVESLFDITFR